MCLCGHDVCFNDVDELMVTVAGDIDFAGVIIVLKLGLIQTSRSSIF